jgi:hypothetical protein
VIVAGTQCLNEYPPLGSQPQALKSNHLDRAPGSRSVRGLLSQ